jgi:hypothetical protein
MKVFFLMMRNPLASAKNPNVVVAFDHGLFGHCGAFPSLVLPRSHFFHFHHFSLNLASEPSLVTPHSTPPILVEKISN